MSKAGVLAFTKVCRDETRSVCGSMRCCLVSSTLRCWPRRATGGVADWLAPRMSGPLLSSGQVADAVVELVVGDHNGVAWSLEVDLDGSARVVAVV